VPVQDRSEQSRKRSEILRNLKEEFLLLAVLDDRNSAGLKLEGLLTKLFEAFELKPRQPFRVTGEQIDGSFELDANVYVSESKWEKQPLPEADLLVFHGKIQGKSTFTRGVLVALNDVSLQGRDSITRGKTPCFFVINGHDLPMILNEEMSFDEYLRKRVRLLGEQGRMFVPISDLL
jgi:hypothetical protein